MVTCEGGLRLIADVVIGADGVDSVVRPVVLGSFVPTPDSVNRFLVS